MKKALLIVILCLASIGAVASIFLYARPVKYCPLCGKKYENAPDTIYVSGGYRLMYTCTYCGGKHSSTSDSTIVIIPEQVQSDKE